MNVDTWLKWAKTQIDTLDAEIIATSFLAPEGYDRSWLVANGEREIKDLSVETLNDMVSKRKTGMPLAYVLCRKEFYGRDFITLPGALIPRPETETLIDLVKELGLPRRARILDMGTGSGCIGITLALEIPQSYVMAADISVAALDVANANNTRFEGRVELVQSNLFESLELDPGYPEYDECSDSDEYFDGYDPSLDERRFDVVVANLPYVSRNWRWVDTEQLKFEPKEALFAKGQNGLAMYEKFFGECNANVMAHYVVVEADPCQHDELVEIAEKNGFSHIKTEGYGLVFENPCYVEA